MAPSPCPRERGSVTAEFAIALPAIVLVLAACLAGVQLAGVQVRLIDAAAMAARSLGRGENLADAAARASRLVPGAVLRESTRGELACANLTLGVAGWLTLQATSCALAGGR